MRRVGLVVLVVAALAGSGIAAPAAWAVDPVAGEAVCTVSDQRALELSGLVATDDGYIAVSDGNDNAPAAVFYMDPQCKVTRVQNLSAPSAFRARDPEDVALAKDGTLWVADIGDNNGERKTVALWKVPTDGSSQAIFRYEYPDGAHDAEAFLLNADDSPIFITKDTAGVASVYVLAQGAKAVAGSATGAKLTKAGTISPERTTTPNFLGAGVTPAITGGANSPDGKKVVLRTYADAYEWDVPDGNVVAAITKDGAKPRITALPNEPQGEAITYTKDGANFVTVSDVAADREPAKLLKYKAAVPAPKPSASAKPTTDTTASQSLFQKLSLTQITMIIGSVGLLGLILVVVGIVGIRRSRKARKKSSASRVRGRVPVGGGWEGDRGRSGRGRGRDKEYDDYGHDEYASGYDYGQPNDGYGYDQYADSGQAGTYGQSEYGQAGTYGQPAGYGQSSGYDQSAGYDQGGYDQAGQGGQGGYHNGYQGQQSYPGYDDYDEQSGRSYR